MSAARARAAAANESIVFVTVGLHGGLNERPRQHLQAKADRRACAALPDAEERENVRKSPTSIGFRSGAVDQELTRVGPSLPASPFQIRSSVVG